MDILETLKTLVGDSGFTSFFADGGWKNLIMIVISCVLLYLGIVKKFEPLLLVGIAFGCLLVNVSNFFDPSIGEYGLSSENALYHPELWSAFLDESSEFYHSYGHIMKEGGLLDILYIGVKTGLYPSLIFLGVGAMTDFGPLLSNPKSLLLGAAAQMGVFLAFFGAVCLGFDGNEAASIGIIGGADGPTAIFLTGKLAPDLLGPIAIAAYSYMALIPANSASAYETSDNRKGALSQDGADTRGFKDGENHFPDYRCTFRNSSSTLNSSSRRMSYAGKSLEGLRSYRKTFRYRPERTYEYRNNFPRNLSRRNYSCGKLSQYQNS